MLDNPTLVGRIVSATDLCQRRKFPKSLRLLRAILKEAADAPPALLASVYVTLAGVLLKTGEFGALKLCCMNAMTLFHDTNDWQPMLRVVHGVRQAEWLMGDYEGAMRTLAMHMKMMRELNMERSMEYVILLSRMIIMRSRMPPRIVGWQITVDMQAVVAQLPPPPEGIRDKEVFLVLFSVFGPNNANPRNSPSFWAPRSSRSSTSSAAPTPPSAATRAPTRRAGSSRARSRRALGAGRSCTAVGRASGRTGRCMARGVRSCAVEAAESAPVVGAELGWAAFLAAGLDFAVQTGAALPTGLLASAVCTEVSWFADATLSLLFVVWAAVAGSAAVLVYPVGA